jgi:hypothetical protein
VWLLNPNGVLFGQGARIDVAGLVTSTLNLNNADWLAGKHRFVQGAGQPASVVNQGELRSSLGGQMHAHRRHRAQRGRDQRSPAARFVLGGWLERRAGRYK